ncbi:fidgetin-like protein 1 [Pecten maximus]|uniref:fidgetin-like protein 1 n=1 Tax=Pecten maximus TaxID=6579 RepID=UPI00145885FC|nr:fidgetin-like protein 1 [Pecten maximus]
MEFPEDEVFLHHLQSQLFDPKLCEGRVSERADLTRQIIASLRLAADANIISADSSSHLIRPFDNSYASLIDSLDSTTGLNNFAEGALALCSPHKNESNKWQTSLTLEKLMGMKCVEDVMKKSQEHADMLVPPSQRNAILFSRRVKNINPPKSELDLGQINSFKHHSRSGHQEMDGGSDPTIPRHQDLNSDRLNTEDQGNWSNTNNARQQMEKNQLGENDQQFVRPLNRKPLFSNNNVTGKGVYGQFGGQSEHNSGQFRGAPGQSNGQFGGQPEHHSGQFRGAPGQSNGQFGGQSEHNSGQFRGAPGQSNGQFGGKPEHHSGQFRGQYTNQQKSWRGGQGGGIKRPFNSNEDNLDNQESPVTTGGAFRTAREQLKLENQKKYGGGGGTVSTASYGSCRKSLGTRRAGPSGKFVPPVINKGEDDGPDVNMNKVQKSVFGKGASSSSASSDEPEDERLKGIEPKMIELVMNEIMDNGPQMNWTDIAGLEFAKKCIKEIVVWPMLRPDIFKGLRGPPKGLLLFGPPGTGKTLIGKCIASQSRSTFFSISASSLTSKWVGEGEKMVRALFAVARCHQPAVVFIDEIDSLLSQRSDGEHEASRRIKTEFLVQLDGAATSSDDRILVIGATNRPQEIDEAARRRFVKRLYIPLPESQARQHIVLNLLAQQRYQLSDDELQLIQDKSQGYSGADMASLCREAAMGPIRSMSFGDIESISADEVRPILFCDFEEAFLQVKASVSDKDLDLYIDWNTMYGSVGMGK